MGRSVYEKEEDLVRPLVCPNVMQRRSVAVVVTTAIVVYGYSRAQRWRAVLQPVRRWAGLRARCQYRVATGCASARGSKERIRLNRALLLAR